MRLTKLQLDRMDKLKTDMIYNAIKGNYKGYKNAKKEYSSLAIKDFDTLIQLSQQKPTRPSVTVPLFSKFGMNMLYIRIRDAFRIKTTDEKIFKSLAQEAEIKNLMS